MQISKPVCHASDGQVAPKSKHHIVTWICKSRTQTGMETDIEESSAYGWSLKPLLKSYLIFCINISPQLNVQVSCDHIFVFVLCFFLLVSLDVPSLPACRFLHANNDMVPDFLPSWSPLICQEITHSLSYLLIHHNTFSFYLFPHAFIIFLFFPK